MIYDFILKNLYIFLIIFILLFILLIIEIYDIFESKNFINVTDALFLINQNKAIILDLRSSLDYNEKHIINSINIPIEKLNNNINLLDKYKLKTIIIVYYDYKNVKKFFININKLNLYKIKYFKFGLKEWIDNDMPTISS